MLAHVIPIHIDPGTLQKQVLIAAELLIVPISQLQVSGVDPPNIMAQIVCDGVLEVVPVREVLVGMLEDELSDGGESADKWQDWLVGGE
jgi:hypothetical protein